MTSSAPSIMKRLTPERGFDLIRMYLGAGLAARGVLFLVDPSAGGELMNGQSSVTVPLQVVALGHCLGGAMLGLGLFTRIAAAVQVFPVLGAVLLLHSGDDLAGENQSLEFSALVLVMLLFYAALGSGEWSLDHRRKSKKA